MARFTYIVRTIIFSREREGEGEQERRFILFDFQSWRFVVLGGCHSPTLWKRLRDSVMEW